MAKSRIRKFRESFLYAGRGLRLCITGERNFRVHMTAAFYVTAAAVMGHVTSTEAAVLCLCFGLTMGAELMNTAVERLCDKTARGYEIPGTITWCSPLRYTILSKALKIR